MSNFPKVTLSVTRGGKSASSAQSLATNSSSLIVHISRTRKSNQKTNMAFAPYFPKTKEEGCALMLTVNCKYRVILMCNVSLFVLGYWLVLGSADTDSLFHMKRVSLLPQQNSLRIVVPLSEHQLVGPRDLTMYLVSDCYLGLDQQQPIRID